MKKSTPQDAVDNVVEQLHRMSLDQKKQNVPDPLLELLNQQDVQNAIGKITGGLPTIPTQNFSDLVRLTTENKQLREENARMQHQLADLDKTRCRLGKRNELLMNMLQAVLTEEET